MREVRSRSLDLRLGEDYSQLLKSPNDVRVHALMAPPTKEEDLANITEKTSEVPASTSPENRPPESQRSPEGEAQTHECLPSPLRTPPSPTSPTSPPSPVSPASPASPTSPASASLPASTEPRPAAEKQKEGEEAAAATLSSAVTLVDVYPKTASKPVYTRYSVKHLLPIATPNIRGGNRCRFLYFWENGRSFDKISVKIVFSTSTKV